MKTLRKSITTWLIFLASLILSHPASATTQININYDTTSFKDQKLTSGLVEVSVSYEQRENSDADSSNLQYQISYNGTPQVNASAYTRFNSSVFLKDLDSNGVAEVIIKTFSGGAHCCTNTTIYTFNNNKFIKTETGELDGYGGSFEDLNSDGKIEFVTNDNSFFYAFSSYAGSFPPSRIYTFKNGKLEDVTRSHKKHLKAVAWEMYQALLESKKRNDSEVNGILAGYVAQKALLGEYQDAWKFMLNNYDPSSDWGLAIYQGDIEVGTYGDFPTALKAFLINQGYLNENGEPI